MLPLEAHIMKTSISCLLLSVWCVRLVAPSLSPDALKPRFNFTLDEQQCPDIDNVNPHIFFSSHVVPLGAPLRASCTVPPGFALRPSSVPGAGLGVFTTSFIRKHTWLAAYEGFVTSGDSEDFLYYAWEVTADGEQIFYIDGVDSRRSNWLRYINGARHMSEENVVMAQCYESIYYRTNSDLPPGTELLVDYGPSYVKQIGLDYNLYNDPKRSPTTTKKRETC